MGWMGDKVDLSGGTTNANRNEIWPDGTPCNHESTIKFLRTVGHLSRIKIERCNDCSKEWNHGWHLDEEPWP